MSLRLRAVVLAAVIASPVAAQDLPFDPAPIEACLADVEGDAKRACIGLAADPCTQTPDGYTMVGMGFCFGKERDWWDARLNAAYTELRALHAKQDEENASYGLKLPKVADALRDMQRAWIDYRDSACDYERSQWGGGTGGGPATSRCQMQMTGEQALALEAKLEQETSR